jgi:integrase
VARGIDPQAQRKAERVKGERDHLSKLNTFLDERYEPWMLTEFKTGAEQLKRIRADFADYLDKPMTDFNEVMIMGLRQKWKKAAKQPATINRDLQRIGSVLTRAVKEGVLSKNPLKGLKPMKYDKSGRVRFLSAAEESALRDALIAREDRMRAERIRMNTHLIERGEAPLPERAGDHLDHLRPIVLVALNTGLRRGELFSLKGANVNLDAEMVTVIAATAKSGQTRRVPLNAEALAVLKAWRKRSANTAADDFVFPGADGARLTNINKSWGGVVKTAKLAGFNFHDLRHTFASRLVGNSIDLNTVRTLLGHKDIETTLIYAHLDPDNLKAAVKKVAVAS